MRHAFIDKYSNISSPVQKIDPLIKLLSALLIILALVSQPYDRFLPFAVYGLLVLVLLMLSRIPPVYVMKRLLIVLPFILFAAVFFPLSVKLSDSSIRLSLYHPAVMKGISIFIKAALSVVVIIVLVSAEKFHHLLRAMRRLKMPAVVCITSALMYRYIFILADESMRTSLARQSRTPGKLKQNRLKVYGNQMAVVFLRSWDRSKIVYNAMLSKGFSGEFPASGREKIKAAQIIFFCILLLSLTYIRFMEHINAFVKQIFIPIL